MNDSRNSNNSNVFRLNCGILHAAAGLLWLNAVIVLFFIGALFYTAESNISEMANALSGNEFVIETKPEGFEIPSFLSGIFPERTRYAVREFTGDESNRSFWNKVYTLRYRVWIPHNNGYHSLDFHMAGIIGLFLKLSYGACGA
jgi:hypothetical protein